MPLFILRGAIARGAPMTRLVLGLVLIALPFLELALLIKAGQIIGFWATLAIVVSAGLLGAFIWSRQGVSVARKTQQALAQGRPPMGPVLDGAFLLLAGGLLITPGFLSDALALLLLIPPVRHKVSRWVVRRLAERAHVQVKTFEASIRETPSQGSRGADQVQGPVIEGEFERLGEKSRTPHRDKDDDRV
jgi:UPF0716 protein FxsA